MFKNVTVKLTLSYLSVVMIISLIFSAVVYRVGSDNLTFGLNRETQELSTAFPIFNGTPFASPNATDLKIGKQHLLDELVLTNMFVLVLGGLICYILARETIRPIETAHEQQKHFTADVSHELRTPLTALKMESEVALMDKSLKADDLRQVIISNMEEASKLENLINSLLKLTRLEAGELQQQFTSLDLELLTNEAVDHVKTLAMAKNIFIDVKSQSININGDHDSLVQLMVIFLDNAIKYSQTGTKIKIAIGHNPTKPTIKIEDQGQGISSRDLEHAFDRFFRADTARSGNSGYGLGLSIAKLIADVHQANITITSQLNHGTTVSVDFNTNIK